MFTGRQIRMTGGLELRSAIRMAPFHVNLDSILCYAYNR